MHPPKWTLIPLELFNHGPKRQQIYHDGRSKLFQYSGPRFGIDHGEKPYKRNREHPRKSQNAHGLKGPIISVLSAGRQKDIVIDLDYILG